MIHTVELTLYIQHGKQTYKKKLRTMSLCILINSTYIKGNLIPYHTIQEMKASIIVVFTVKKDTFLIYASLSSIYSIYGFNKIYLIYDTMNSTTYICHVRKMNAKEQIFSHST
jgi:hypothetical protein